MADGESRDDPLGGGSRDQGPSGGGPANQGPGGMVGPPDIGLGNSGNPSQFNRNMPRPECEGSSTPGNEASPVQQVSFFSLRHFLRENADGARGGFMEGGPGVPHVSPPRAHDMGQGLPDFVQDHLVVEQAYLGGHQETRNVDMRFDLTEMEHMQSRDDMVEGASGGGISGISSSSAAQSSSSEVGPSKSLPDFLSDGPIRQRDREPASIQVENDRLQSENERMRIELGMLRQQLSQQVQRNEDLETEVTLIRSRGNTVPINHEKMQEELERLTNRALAAETRLSRLVIENNTLRSQLMRSKNRDPRCSGAASTSAQQTQSERLASQLRNAAFNAEVSLRQLLTGVDNLRHLADNLDPPTSPRVQPSSGDSGDDDDDIYMQPSSHGHGKR
ncbi:Serologically defined colon cancer antigen 3 [Nesidiocoris tenuis]|uniref:Endosome-associated-trafficking regulator 1 n=1 Tax=Nesidiocoris tenuis TaxID=355587 RepID=A0ABN7BFP3_9HEMI|nr:Serologically defined colon cancer antigen 3 [Nesidiocoris tenuis]